MTWRSWSYTDPIQRSEPAVGSTVTIANLAGHMPAGYQTGDLLVLIVHGYEAVRPISDITPNVPTGWTQAIPNPDIGRWGAGTYGVGSGAGKVERIGRVYVRRATGSADDVPVVTATRVGLPAPLGRSWLTHHAAIMMAVSTTTVGATTADDTTTVPKVAKSIAFALDLVQVDAVSTILGQTAPPAMTSPGVWTPRVSRHVIPRPAVSGVPLTLSAQLAGFSWLPVRASTSGTTSPVFTNTTSRYAVIGGLYPGLYQGVSGFQIMRYATWGSVASPGDYLYSDLFATPSGSGQVLTPGGLWRWSGSAWVQQYAEAFGSGGAATIPLIGVATYDGPANPSLPLPTWNNVGTFQVWMQVEIDEPVVTVRVYRGRVLTNFQPLAR